ncbi:hypothetical protein ACFV1F_45005 [Streptomyces sp. NPDC059590]|uniref:hypothetical protein n=1 Tax=Streptomyces sp. NPDC059590 TaxID=3346877 RepID=UPI00367464ED
MLRHTGRNPRRNTASQVAAATPGMCSERKSSRATTPVGTIAVRAASMSPATCSYRCAASTWTKRQLSGATWRGTSEVGPWTTSGAVAVMVLSSVGRLRWGVTGRHAGSGRQRRVVPTVSVL